MSRERLAAAGELRGSVHVILADVFKLADAPEIVGAKFDTAVDSAVMHCIGDDDAQARYVAALAGVVRPGGHLVLQACSDRNPDPWEGPPRRISEARMRQLLCEDTGWRVDSVRHCLYENRMGFKDGACPAIWVVATRLGEQPEAPPDVSHDGVGECELRSEGQEPPAKRRAAG
mmetsp:Transcript_50984/g.131581  ORF Transcript_50984/g.131581 Transcript_50984/m.131581 type:complete len:174 (+) Transcript_50984:3-524(+)